MSAYLHVHSPICAMAGAHANGVHTHALSSCLRKWGCRQAFTCYFHGPVPKAQGPVVGCGPRVGDPWYNYGFVQESWASFRSTGSTGNITYYLFFFLKKKQLQSSAFVIKYLGGQRKCNEIIPPLHPKV